MKPYAFDEVDKLHDELVHHVEASKLVLKFLEKKIALEEEYATQVRQLCKAQPSLGGSSGTSGCFSVLVSLICDQASTTLNNLAALSIDAISPLKAALLQLKGDVNELYSEGKKLQHERKKAFDNYKKAKCVYESVIQDSPADKTTAAENDYKFHITFVNRNQSSFFHDQLPTIISQFQAAETLRATRTHEGIQKCLSYMSDSFTKTNELLKMSNDKLNKPPYSVSNEIDKFRKFCEEYTQPPSDVQFGDENKEAEKADFLSPGLRTILKHGKSASAKWRNSFTSLTSPNRDTKKVKRQSMPARTATCIFGTPLHILLEHQKKTYPKLDIPYVAYYLVNHIKKIGGMQTENVFRVPGMTVEVQNIKAALEAGEFSEDLLFSSVHSAASAFTMWLRELPSPLIPFYMHPHCLGYKTNEELLHIFYGLPSAHCNMLVFLLSFIADLAKPENYAQTHMSADNLSMVFTPSILRSQSSADVLTNIEKERQFVKSAIDASDMLGQTFSIRLQVHNPDQSPIKI
jgi:hypothetical protein